ncbi:uncharacterized protein LOC129753755 [Uranotaenia lowii]|uniref:uncharacterized protein LOC129753755 n=1 Tax=Uranotaenia lowii TaxID=190385 RepID=UPI00247B255E|nr:uncharacterized protein LOC129753755 [Uranotaenia lowii]XP_055605578.1 uncharacterized protein LOC129753755 [Uranotaenia lowii]
MVEMSNPNSQPCDATNHSSNESVSHRTVQQNGPHVLDANYIEHKIKNLLNEDHQDEKIHSNRSDKTDEIHTSKHVVLSGILATEDSCNAVDHKITLAETRSIPDKVSQQDLSFNGKINSLRVSDANTSSATQLTGNSATKTTNVKVCLEKLNESFELLTKEDNSLMHYNNEKSPDLFADEDDDKSESLAEMPKSDEEDERDNEKLKSSAAFSSCVNDPVGRVEQSILRRLQASLSGILPPPSVTHMHIDANRMLNLYRENEATFFYRNSNTNEISARQTSEAGGYLNKPTHSEAELRDINWPQLLKIRAHGLHYNRSTVTEKIELLGLKYVDRYIGAETSTTFSANRSPSSTRKRNLRLKMLSQSPGSRLSHLARRRAVFSSANLINSSSLGSSSASSSGRLCNRQILLDPKKSDNRRKNKGRTPKRRTPGRRKTPKRKTPGSSAKKRTLSLPVAKPTTTNRETSKRALFQSPPSDASKAAMSAINDLVAKGSSVAASKVQKSKRALFSPPKRAHRFSSVSNGQSDLSVKESLMSSNRYGSTNNIDNLRDDTDTTLPTSSSGKRRRPTDDDDELRLQQRSEKLPRLDSVNEEDLTPRSLKLARSQSFCIGSQNMNTKSASEKSFCGRSLFRANSEVTFPDSVSRPITVLTENHKKKLLWAVSQALQSKQITVKHEQFKQHASNLARIVKRLFLEFNDQTISSTSEKMLRLANKHVYDVIQGRNVDDIYLKEKTRIMNAKNLTKLQGYIAPEEYEQRKQFLQRSSSTSHLILDNSHDSSMCASTSQLGQLSQSSIFSQSLESINQLSQSSLRKSQLTGGVEATALRENIDSEQRQKSAQKQVSFSGKDQKNVSPYADQKPGSQKKAKLLVGGALTSSILKAKRQISFE